MGHQAKIDGGAPVYFDQAPVITDAGHGMVLICQPDGTARRIMPIETFEGYIFAGLQFIREYRKQHRSIVVAFRRGDTDEALKLVSLGIDD